MKYEKEIEHLKKLRAEAFDLDYRLTYLIVATIILTIFEPFLGMIFGVLVSYFNSKKVNAVVNTPCPRCEEPFGKEGKFIIDLGPNECQNCHLKLAPNAENYTSKTVYMALSIIIGCMGVGQIYLWSIGKMNDYGFFLGIIFIIGAAALALYLHRIKKTEIR